MCRDTYKARHRACDIDVPIDPKLRKRSVGVFPWQQKRSMEQVNKDICVIFAHLRNATHKPLKNHISFCRCALDSIIKAGRRSSFTD